MDQTPEAPQAGAFSPYPATPASAKAYHVLLVEREDLTIPQAEDLFRQLSADLATFTFGVAVKQGMAALAQWTRYDQAPEGTGSLAVAYAQSALA